MNPRTTLAALSRDKGQVWIAAGFFDGVHRGHQAVIRRVIRESARRGAKAWIMTFDIHPLKLLNPAVAPPLLTATDHKIKLLLQQGIRGCVVLRFTRALAALNPEDFILKLVNSVKNLGGIVVGNNWTFGKGGAGTPGLLAQLGALNNFKVSVVQPVRWKQGFISSTRIRRAVAAGRLNDAAAMLGRPFSVVGTVVSGRGIGRRLGTPTANLGIHNEVLPAAGVYAVRAVIGGRIHDGVANIGFRPTFTGARRGKPPRPVLETHLFGMQGDIRGREMEVFFIRKLREERRFRSPGALKKQIARDIPAAARALARRRGGG